MNGRKIIGVKKEEKAGTVFFFFFFLNIIFDVNWLLWETENFPVINKEYLTVGFNICRENKVEECKDIYM